MTITKEDVARLHLLAPDERKELLDQIRKQRPTKLKPYFPKWWWWTRCVRNVLVVTDSLNFGTGNFGLSEFLTAFTQLEAQSSIDYHVTTAYHRTSGTQSANPIVVNHFDSFEFTDVDLDEFDQIWLFGSNGLPLLGPEVTALTNYMDNGGGLFATGDHGSLGNALCGAIPRVEDMRHWGNFGSPNEVSMSGTRRNDTNQPPAGAATSTQFADQSDAIPQTIAARTSSAGNPHPLLSISASLRPSRVIDIMPDHPHEGECKQETSFTVNGVAVPTQVIATSFVIGGNTSGTKDPTDPHCFPSIAVWDGWKADAGRIVVDSTWHHFVNINLDGGSAGPGLTAGDWQVVRQYFMNIATWMSRRRIWWCWWRWLVFELVIHDQVVEASIEATLQSPEEAKLGELQSIGMLAEQILADAHSPGLARSFLLDLLDGLAPELVENLDEWVPRSAKSSKKQSELHGRWIDLDQLLHTAVGAGIVAIRADKKFASGVDVREKSLEAIDGLFNDGAQIGFARALADLESDYRRAIRAIKPKKKKGD